MNQCSLSAVSQFLNTQLLKNTATSRLSQLKATKLSLQRQLCETIQDINLETKRNQLVLSEEMLGVLKKMFPFISFSVGNNAWNIYCIRTPVQFHKAYRREDDDNTIYRTFPIYDFTVEIINTRFTIRNSTDYCFKQLDTPNCLYTETDDTVWYSHPHVSGCNGAEDDAFRNLCTGNNNFHTMLDKVPLEPGDIVEFVRGLALWISRVNLDDAYHNPLYEALCPRREMASRELGAFAEKQYAWTCQHVTPLLQATASPPLHSVREVVEAFKSWLLRNPSHVSDAYLGLVERLCDLPAHGHESYIASFTPLLLQHTSYALWLYTIAQRYTGLGLTLDLQNALLTDLDVSFTFSYIGEYWRYDDHDDLETWRQNLLAGSRNLKRYDTSGEIFSRIEHPTY